MAWSIDWQGQQLADDQVMGAHLALIALLTSDSWATIDPRRSPGALMGWLTMVDMIGNGTPIADARARVAAATAAEIVAALTVDDASKG